MPGERFDSSEAAARRILGRYVEAVTADVGGAIEAIVLAGSLAMGSYVPGPGDIDQITILRRGASDGVEAAVGRHVEEAMAAFARAVNLSPTVYRRAHLDRPWRTEWDLRPETKHLVSVPEELLRIHDHGQVIHGAGFELSALPRPTTEEMRAYHERWRAWNREIAGRTGESGAAGQRPPLRIAAQVALSNAIWHYYYATGRTCFDKHEIAGRLRSDVPHYAFQAAVDLATRVRMSGFAGISDDDWQALSGWCEQMRAWNAGHAVGAVPLAEMTD